MRTMKHLALAAAAAAALALAGCGGGGGGAKAPGDTTPPAKPTTVTMNLSLTPAMQTAIRGFFPNDAQNSQTISIPAGTADGPGSVTRGSVIFTCDSAYPCTVTLTNELDAVVAKYETQRVGTATAMVTALLSRQLGVFQEMNLANAASAQKLIVGGFGAATYHDSQTTGDPPTSNARVGDNRSLAVEGMGLGHRGPLSVTDMKWDVALRGPFDANNETTDYVDGSITVVTAPGEGESKGSRMQLGDTNNAARGGSVLSDKSSALGGEDAPAYLATYLPKVEVTGWRHKALFSDWGDTHSPGRDGGFETGALVYSDVEKPTDHPFDVDLGARFVNEFRLPGILQVGDNNDASRTPYHLNVNLDGETGNDAVEFTVDPASDTPGGEGSHVNANVAGAGSLQINVSSASDASFQKVEGDYLGVAGTYTCDGTGDTACRLSRTKGADHFTLGTGRWQFTPAADAMVSVPDQDWMVFGAWATTPDDMANGGHRIGAFFDGMNVYRTVDNSLTGKAEYKGGAAGYYVEGTDAGFFTAKAALTADFGTAETAGTLSGRIDNFKDSAGRFLGDDTPGNPNDPVKGGENDWVVLLESITLGTEAIGITDGRYNSLANDATRNTGGSADGVAWSGSWSANFYGPGDQPTTKVYPTGVAGNFDANTTTGTVFRGVTGSFGATLQTSAASE